MKTKRTQLGIVLSLGCLTAATALAAESSPRPVTPGAPPEAVALLKFFYDISGKQVLSGQHNFPGDKNQHTLNSAKAWGKTPAIFGKDWGFARAGDKDSAYVRSNLVAELIDAYKNGALVTMCWHQVPPTADEPVTFRPPRGGRGGATNAPAGTNTPLNTIQGQLTDAQYQDLLTPGTDLNNRWRAQVDAIVPYLKQLEAARVPLLWRPVHEMNGTWFWWCGRRGDTTAIYKMTFDRLVKHHQIKNLIWVWSVDRPEGTSLKYEDCWPGPEYVDILSLDCYGEFKQSYYDDLLKLANGKPIALAEVGGTLSLAALEAQPKWTWWMTWAGMGARGDATNRFSAIVNAPRSWSLSDPEYRKAIAPIRAASGLNPEPPAPEAP